MIKDYSSDYLKDLQSKQDELQGGISIVALLTDNFLKNHTKFNTFNEFANAIQEFKGDFEIDSKLDEFVSKISDFSSFSAMTEKAMEEYTINLLSE